jgi:hypothetical protein
MLLVVGGGGGGSKEHTFYIPVLTLQFFVGLFVTVITALFRAVHLLLGHFQGIFEGVIFSQEIEIWKKIGKREGTARGKAEGATAWSDLNLGGTNNQGMQGGEGRCRFVDYAREREGRWGSTAKQKQKAGGKDRVVMDTHRRQIWRKRPSPRLHSASGAHAGTVASTPSCFGLKNFPSLKNPGN